MSKIWMVATLCLVLHFCTLEAKAQTSLPQGSYQQTCTNITLQGNTLTAVCQTVAGSWVQTQLNNINLCGTNIGNVNGTLSCDQFSNGSDERFKVSTFAVASMSSWAWASPGTAPGEAQSTVVPPNVNAGCPSGQILISNDWIRGVTGTVMYYSLRGGSPQTSTFSAPPIPSVLSYVSNDHDLISLPDGTVLYLTGAGYIANSSPAPIPNWFVPPNPASMGTFRILFPGDTFGPNARGVVAVWRSDDCGQNFRLVSIFDPVQMGDGSCAFPQFRRQPAPSNAQILAPPFDMGGSDGQMVTFDPGTADLFLNFRCVGFLPVPDQRVFEPDLTQPLDKTDLAMSPDHGSTWILLGVPPVNQWRAATRSVGNQNTLAFGSGSGTVTFARRGVPPPGEMPGSKPPPPWAYDTKKPPYLDPDGWVGFQYPACMSNTVQSSDVTTRTGDNQFALIYPSMPPNPASNLFGYSMYFFTLSPDASGSTLNSTVFWSQQPTHIEPVESSNAYIMHLTAIDPGNGPTLLYWYDVDSAQQRARIRGRLIFGFGNFTEDFDISQSFSLCPPAATPYKNPYFYGDYNTAGGYFDGQTSTFMPIWIEPNGGVSYTAVTASLQSGPPPPPPPSNPPPPPPPGDRDQRSRVSGDTAGVRVDPGALHLAGETARILVTYKTPGVGIPGIKIDPKTLPRLGPVEANPYEMLTPGKLAPPVDAPKTP